MLVAANKYLAKGSQGKERVYSGSQSEAVVHHGRDAMATGASVVVHTASMVRKQRELNAGAPLTSASVFCQGPQPWIVVLACRVGFPSSINSSKLSFTDSLVHSDYRKSLLFWAHWAFHTRGRCTLVTFTRNHNSLSALNTKYWH